MLQSCQRDKAVTPQIWRQSTYLRRLGQPALSYQLGKQPTHKFKVRAPCSREGLHLVMSFGGSPRWHRSVPASSPLQGSDGSVRPGAPSPCRPGEHRDRGACRQLTKAAKSILSSTDFYILPSGQACISKNKFLTSTRWRFLTAALRRTTIERVLPKILMEMNPKPFQQCQRGNLEGNRRKK